MSLNGGYFPASVLLSDDVEQSHQESRSGIVQVSEAGTQAGTILNRHRLDIWIGHSMVSEAGTVLDDVGHSYQESRLGMV
jgi:hypothetical protein